MQPSLKQLFIEHPHSVNETYLEHLFAAGGFALRLLFAGLVCLVHALLPFLFVKTGSEQITALYHTMVKNRINNQTVADKPTTLDKAACSFNFEI